MRSNSLIVLTSISALALFAGDLPQAQAQTQTAGKITGKISFKGVVPAPMKVRMAADPRCLQANPDGAERRQIDGKDGGLASVIVAIKSAVPGTHPAKTAPVLLDQVGCMYTPSAIALQVGQPLRMRNSDNTLHNVHPRPKVNQGFNIGQPRKGMETEKTFDKAETFFPVGCDVHPWMRSYVAVFDHPFFTVTADDGTFEIPGVPPGEYEVEAQHPTLKMMTGKVVVKAGAPAILNLTYTLK